MSTVEVRHRASEALQKPSMHETARHESRLWIFDPVSSRAAERKQEAKRSEPLWGRRQIGCLASCVVCSSVILLHGSRSTDQPGQGMVAARRGGWLVLSGPGGGTGWSGLKLSSLRA